jgi:hypothetical protein
LPSPEQVFGIDRMSAARHRLATAGAAALIVRRRAGDG